MMVAKAVIAGQLKENQLESDGACFGPLCCSAVTRRFLGCSVGGSYVGGSYVESPNWAIGVLRTGRQSAPMIT